MSLEEIEPIGPVKRKKSETHPVWVVPLEVPFQMWQGSFIPEDFAKLIFEGMSRVNQTTQENTENTLKDHRERSFEDWKKRNNKKFPRLNTNFSNHPTNLLNQQVAIIG